MHYPHRRTMLQEMFGLRRRSGNDEPLDGRQRLDDDNAFRAHTTSTARPCVFNNE